MSYDEEFLAQDYFSDDVGRILTFDGSHVLTQGNDCLREVAAKFADHKVTFHALIALANAAAIDYKQLNLPTKVDHFMSAQQTGGRFVVKSPNLEEARRDFSAALTAQPDLAAESLGHVDYKYYTDRFSDWLAAHGDIQGATETQQMLYNTLSERNVAERVLATVEAKRAMYAEATAKPRRKK